MKQRHILVVVSISLLAVLILSSTVLFTAAQEDQLVVFRHRLDGAGQVAVGQVLEHGLVEGLELGARQAVSWVRLPVGQASTQAMQRVHNDVQSGVTRQLWGSRGSASATPKL